MSTFASKVLTGSVLAVIGLVTVRLVMAAFGLVTSFFSFLLFTVLPIAIIAWLVIKVFKYMTREKTPA